ncbi:MAG: biotin/lipoyl-binding protein [Pirellulales bacterium]|nr:biotin/lipoyl-binding protein [Pirellulales bacterium]
MPSLADSLVSSSARKLALRVRPELSARRHKYQGRTYWVVKEPVGLNYFRFQEEEYAILRMLDGTVSLDDIKERFEAQFPPEKITVEEIQHFIGTLHRSGLVIADVPGQGKQLLERRNERRRKELLQMVGNILSLRFKGIDPDRILNWLYPKVSWFFTTWCLALCVLAAASALLLVLVQFDEFQSRLPTFHQFFSAKNFLLLGGTLAITKILHEFGHALTCKHFGGECHEMGVMILVLTPCLYVNVSDSWMLPNKWHRAAIGAAGMYVELCIATICTYVWWFSEPGVLNHLCLSTMFVCSVSTLIFNANPLLRYDGYYILSDILEIPNLRQKSSTILSRTLSEWCLGLEPPDDPFLPERNQWLFATYTVAAVIYRWVVVFSILFFLNKVFEPYRLKIIGQIIAMGSVWGLLGQPMVQLFKFMRVPGRTRQVKKLRLLATVGVVAAVIAAVCLIPLPYRVNCTFEVKARDASNVYVDTAGILSELNVQPGDRVEEGQVLAVLRNPEIELEMNKLETQLAECDARTQNLQAIAFDDPTASGDIAVEEEKRPLIVRQIEEKQHDLDSLELRAPAAGFVLPPPETPARPQQEEEQLPGWIGTPLKEQNIGAMLSESTLFCQIGDPTKMQAVLVIDQSDLLFVSRGQDVDLMLEQMPGRVFSTKIEDIANLDLKQMPKPLSNKAGGDLPTKTDEAGNERPMSASYQARAAFDGPTDALRLGLRGQAKIYARPQTLGQRLYRLVVKTFNFDL